MMYENHKTGYSLIEVMIAVAILMAAIVAPMTVAIKSIQSSRYTLEQNTATFLAQESISIMEALRNHYALLSITEAGEEHWEWTDDFGRCETATGCNFDATDPYDLTRGNSSVIACSEDGENCRLYFNADSRSAYRVGAGSGEETPFVRRVFITNRNEHEMTLRVEVSWDTSFLGQEQKVSVTSSVFNLYRSF